jgi:hypothetical protein
VEKRRSYFLSELALSSSREEIMVSQNTFRKLLLSTPVKMIEKRGCRRDFGDVSN